MMEAWINNIIEYLKQVAMPILFLLFIFFVTVAIRMFQEEWRDKYYDEAAFGKTYLIAHGMACGFAFIYSGIMYFVPKNGSGVAAFLMLVLFYWFMIKIVITQNADNGGYIENFEGASGAIMYVTSALSPVVFVVVHALLGGISFFLYKRNDNDEDWKKRIIRRAIGCVEALVATIIVKLFVPHSFIQNPWINSIIIAVFTLIIPFFNDWLYERFSLD